MSSLLSDTEKAALQAALTDVHDTFKRDIFVYIKAQKVASFSDNPFYGNGNPTSSLESQEEFTKYTHQARVMYENDQNQELFDGSAQANLPSSEGQVRIKVDSAAHERIKNASKIEIDSTFFVVDSDAKVVGPFDAQYYMYYLKR